MMMIAHYRIFVTVFVLIPLVACSAMPTPTPISATSMSVIEAVEVDAGGFSFQPIDAFSINVEGAQATMVSQDEQTRFVLEGRSACEVEPLTDVIDAFVRVFAQDTEVFKPGEPYSIHVAGREALAVDVTGKAYEGASGEDHGDLHKIAGRVVLATPTNSQYFFAFASVSDSPDGDRWDLEGELAFNTVFDSISFFAPTRGSRSSPSFPCFINHEPPEQEVDDPLPRLVEVVDEGGCHFGPRGEGYPPFCYGTSQEGHRIVIRTEDELREFFAPIETAAEALHYAKTVFWGRGPYQALKAYYGLQLDPRNSYLADTIESTHVQETPHGFIVLLFRDDFSCQAGPHPAMLAVEVQVTSAGVVREVSQRRLWEFPNGVCIEL